MPKGSGEPGGISRPGEAAGGFSHCSAAILVALELFPAAGPAASHGLRWCHSEHAGTPIMKAISVALGK